jgi:cation:H+ antiporter
VTPFWTTVLFVLSSAVILASGVRLARYGDIIAQKTGLGGTWMGLVVMAAVTSLPEAITGASAILVFDVADIAAGDAIGSCMFNLLILSLLDVRDPLPLTARVHQGHVLSGAFGIVQLGLVAAAIVAGPRAPAIGWIALHSVAVLAIYALAMRTIFVFERKRLAEVTSAIAGEPHYAAITLRRALLSYAAAAGVLVLAAAALPGLGERLAEHTGLGQSFVGSLFVAASTSMPEVVVSVAAARMGALDMAVANLFGSNIFNVAVVGFDDLLYTDGILLEAVSPAHLVTATSAIVMTGAAIVGLTFRAQRKRFRLSWDTFAIVAMYGLGVLLLHQLS